MVGRGLGREKESRMRDLLALVPVTVAILIVAALGFYAIHKEKKRSS